MKYENKLVAVFEYDWMNKMQILRKDAQQNVIEHECYMFFCSKMKPSSHVN